MKVRFSILSLLAFTTYVGVNAGAYADPMSICFPIFVALWLLFLLIAVVLAVGKTSAIAAFGRATILSVLLLHSLSIGGSNSLGEVMQSPAD